MSDSAMREGRWPGTFGRSVIGDLRSSYRTLWRRPRHSISVAAIVGIGIGACGAAAALAHHILLSPLPGTTDSHGLVQVRLQNARGVRYDASAALLASLSQDAASVTVAGSSTATLRVTTSVERAPAIVSGAFVSPRYFDALGVRPATGRMLLASELDPVSNERTAVISEKLWREMFNMSADISGRHLLINEVDHVVVGVAKDFRGINRLRHEDVWLSLGSYPAVRRQPVRSVRTLDVFYPLVGRLGRDVSVARAEAILGARFRSASLDLPGLRSEYRPHLTTQVGLEPAAATRITESLQIIFAVSALVLVASLANASSLAIARLVHSRAEMRLKRALGASGARLLAEECARALLLGVLAAAIAMCVASLLGRVLARGGIGNLPVLESLRSSPVVFAIIGLAAIACIATIAVVTGAAAIRLAETAPVGTAGPHSLPRATARAVFCTVQTAVSLSLMVCTIAMMTTVHRLGAIPVGFVPRGVYTYTVRPGQRVSDSTAQLQLRTALLAVLRETPGVEAAAVASAAPLSGRHFTGSITSGNGSATESIEGPALEVSGRFFETLGMQMQVGQAFDTSVSAAQRAAATEIVLSRETARRLFDQRNPIGQYVLCCRGDLTPRRVIGVVNDVRVGALRGSPEASMFVPLGAGSSESTDFVLLVRWAGNVVRADRAIQRIVHRVDPLVPVSSGVALDDTVKEQFANETTLLLVLGLLASIAAALSGFGLYATLNHAVADRTGEMGIRRALGSSAGSLMALVARGAIVQTSVGIVVGAITSTALIRLIDAHLYGVEAPGALSYFSASLVVACVSALAAFPPLARAIRIDPMIALRGQ